MRIFAITLRQKEALAYLKHTSELEPNIGGVALKDTNGMLPGIPFTTKIVGVRSAAEMSSCILYKSYKKLQGVEAVNCSLVISSVCTENIVGDVPKVMNGTQKPPISKLLEAGVPFVQGIC